MKVYIGVDSAVQHFLWEELIVKELGTGLPLQEIPDDLWLEYWQLEVRYRAMQEKLKALYRKQT